MKSVFEMPLNMAINAIDKKLEKYDPIWRAENGVGGDVWRSMLSQEYAKQIQRSGGVGLSDQIMRDLIQVQARASAGAGNV